MEAFQLPQTVQPEQLLIVVGLLALACVALLWSVVMLRRDLKKERRRRKAAFDKLEIAKREVQRGGADLQLQERFVKSFLELHKDMDNLVGGRALETLLVEMMLRVFEPSQAAVLVKRNKANAPRLTVAATHPATSFLKPGMHFALHEGEIGVLVRARHALTRDDLIKPMYQSTIVGRKQALPGFNMTLGAPMYFKEELYGALLVEAPGKQGPAARKILNVIAQLGAVYSRTSAAYSEVQKTAQLDRLTKVLNKESIRLALESMVRQAQREGFPVSALLFDIDNFKNYNDVNGHLAGDELLTDLAQMIQSTTRDTDIFGRFGGEEFLLVLPGNDSETGMQAAEKVRAMLAEYPFPHAEKQPLGCVSISGGVSTYPECGRDVETLLLRADEALYKAKSSGRNRIGLARPLEIQTAPHPVASLPPTGTAKG